MGPRQVNSPAESSYLTLRNHFRAFSVKLYRFIPHYNLHDIDGRYYDRELAFMTMVELGADAKCGGEFAYYQRKLERVM